MSVDPANAYHTSAVLGAALDVATSPLRFSSTRLDAWASAGAGAGGGGGGGVPLLGGGGAFGGGGRAPAPGADMTLASLSAWLPLPHPDASVETLQRLLLLPPSSHSVLSSYPNTRFLVERNGMVSLGPVVRRRRGLLGPGSRRIMSTSAASVDIKVFSQKMVARGVSWPRNVECSCGGVDTVLNGSGAGSGSSFAVSTPLPIPITYPLLFRESLGSRGEQLFSPPPPSHATSGSGKAGGSGGAGGRAGAGVGDGRVGGGELRVMCDEISSVACVERTSAMGRFLGQV
ncbi:unnamed protein product, partial [Laminaria digitata]